MQIAVWSTGHTIADYIAQVMVKALPNSKLYNTVETLGEDFSGQLPPADMHIAYGILRGTADVFRKAIEAHVPWFNVDRGYIGADHFRGYYRVSLGGTQQTIGLDRLEPAYDRLKRLNLNIYDADKLGDTVIICPPTEYVRGFFHTMDEREWIKKAIADIEGKGYSKYKVRSKENSLQDAEENDFPTARLSYTFNCSLGWKWLARGVPVISDPERSIVGAYGKMLDVPLYIDLDLRIRLFALMASLQMTLEEMLAGHLWPLMNRLMSISDLTVGKQLPVMSQPTV